ncbi:hypothetical protein [Niveispirillum sp. KHB5.9]|uniref:hypothetical protein n=1 Tax=Niveispirillum sp. KHB5.9 TaxID=3400269 RepID=UPI003A8A32C2
MADFTERLFLPGGLLLEASVKRFRLHHLSPWQDHPAETLSPEGDAASTRQLMSGALYAGLSVATMVRPSSAGRDVLLRYIHGLASAWRTTGATPGAMRRAAQRLEDRGQVALADYCRHVAEEETGHDILAWRDIEALDLPAEAFVEQCQPAAAMALAGRQQALAESDEPVAVLGYAYALERTSLNVTAEVVAEVEGALPAGVNATRCLRVHSAVGTDIHHVAESLEFIATLPACDRAIIAREAFNTGRIIGGMDDYPGNGAMHALLSSLGWRHLEPAAAACA